MITSTIDLDIIPVTGKQFHNMEARATSKASWYLLFSLWRYKRRYFPHHKYALFQTFWKDEEPQEARILFE